MARFARILAVGAAAIALASTTTHASRATPAPVYDVSQIKAGLAYSPDPWFGHTVFVRGGVGGTPWPDSHGHKVILLYVADLATMPGSGSSVAELMVIGLLGKAMYHLPVGESRESLGLGAYGQIVEIHIKRHPMCDANFHPRCAIGTGQLTTIKSS
jgi:hypothetical protein